MKKTDWSQPLRNRLAEDYFPKMIEFINQTYQEGKIYPPENQIFRAIELTPLTQTKVIIVGQDPYPQPGKAQGLAFSYPATFKVNRPDSIVNIQKELRKHLILEAAHPSPLSASRGFFGSHPFSKTNYFLVQTGQSPIDWSK